jgi:hypothetical protein
MLTVRQPGQPQWVANLCIFSQIFSFANSGKKMKLDIAHVPSNMDGSIPLFARARPIRVLARLRNRGKKLCISEIPFFFFFFLKKKVVDAWIDNKFDRGLERCVCVYSKCWNL